MNALGSWDLPQELKLLQETTRRFMEKEVRPVEAGEPHDSFKLPKDKLKALQAKARKLGLWCVQTPAEYGGAGLNLLGQCIVAEESAKCKMGAYIAACGAFGFDPPNVIFSGTQQQIEKYAIPAIENGDKTFVAITEAERRLRSRPLDPHPRRAQGRPLYSQRHQDLHLGRQ